MSLEGQKSESGEVQNTGISCEDCKHLLIWPYCLAFMSGSGIPHELREGKLDHLQAVPGDHGIRFLHKDSPYELSETEFKRVITMYAGEMVMPYVDQKYQEIRSEILLGRANTAKPGKAPANLIEASIEGNIEAAKDFLAKGADIDSRDADGNTPLMHACRNCHVDMVKLLLESGCDVTATDKYSKQAIDIAEDWGYPTIVELMKMYMEEE